MGLFSCCRDGKEAGKTRHVFEPLEDETDDTLSCESSPNTQAYLFCDVVRCMR